MPTKDQLTKFDSRSRYRLRCASCGTVLDGRQRVAIYTGDGDAWLHDADEDGSAACGPVLAEWPALAAPEGRPAVAVGDWVLTRFLGGTIIPVKAASVIEVIDPAGITEIRGERNGQPFIWRKEA